MTTQSGPRRVLIADSNDTDVNRYKDFLSDVDCDVQIAADGTNALERARQFAPHLILLDPMLPKVNGFDVCKQIKADPSTTWIMVLMVIALNDLGDVEQAVAAKTDDFLSKPVDKTELLKRVGNLLELQNRLQ